MLRRDDKDLREKKSVRKEREEQGKRDAGLSRERWREREGDIKAGRGALSCSEK